MIMIIVMITIIVITTPSVEKSADSKQFGGSDWSGFAASAVATKHTAMADRARFHRSE
jgi:hypothetical protein